ncbi:MAG: hypothetical protein H0W84_08940 [Bacteroidetes bacterium]|nr:hypothetical protein [Bacteroidota bacterium]
MNFRYAYIFIFFCSFLNAQVKLKTLLLFRIEEATKNGEDVTKTFIDQKAYTVFYKNLQDNSLLMANVWQENKSQSYGGLQTNNVLIFNKPYKSSKAQRSYYIWDYINTYNDTTGIAFLELIQIQKQAGIYYILKMDAGELGFYTFKGYLDPTQSDFISESNK